MTIEELEERNAGTVVARRFAVWSDGLCLYAEAPEVVSDSDGLHVLPVFSKVCAYRMLRSHTRLLARQLFRRGVLDLGRTEPPARQREVGERSIRLLYRAFGNERLVIASGQVRGSMVRVLNVINSYLPPGDSHLFVLPGLAGDREPASLSFDFDDDGVPDVRPVADVAGAMGCYERLLEEWPDDSNLLLSAFALACWEGDQTKARRLLDRWLEAAGAAGTVGEPFSDPPELTREMLEGILQNS